jgi:hypothetical protein
MKPFYHLDNLGTVMDSLLTCNIKRACVEEFTPADKLTYAWTIPEYPVLTNEQFRVGYLNKAIYSIVQHCNTLVNIEVCGLPDKAEKHTTFKYADLPLRYTVERVEIPVEGKQWVGYYFVLDVLVRGLQ